MVNRKHHETDDLIRRLPLRSDADAARLSDTTAKQALFEEIVAMPTTALPPEVAAPGPARARRRRSSVVAAAAALATTAAAGTAWAVFGGATDTTATGCYISENSVSVVDAVTGDPVADCAREWERETGSVPELVAYDTGNAGVAVVPRGREVPSEWMALDPQVRQNPQLIRLSTALDDSLDGLQSACYELPAARAIVERELDAAGLRGWRVAADRGQADGSLTCTFYVADAATRTITLIPIEGLVEPGSEAPPARMAADLREALDGGCRTRSEVVALIRQAARAAGVADIQINEQLDPDVPCASGDMRVGGAVSVTVRGR
jgi:hypothetical protein